MSLSSRKEQHVSTMQEEKGLADEEARERDALYERAESLASALAGIGDTLKSVVEDVNAGKLSCLCLAFVHILTTAWQFNPAF